MPEFEQSLARLQTIVVELDEGALSLDESLRRFEEGMTLLRGCHQFLTEAEQKVQILIDINDAGQPVLEPFDTTATIEQPAAKPGRRRTSKKKTEETPSLPVAQPTLLPEDPDDDVPF